MSKHMSKQSPIYLTRSLAIAALIGSGMFYPAIKPAFAAPPKAGDVITNQATADYKDDSDNDYTSISNPVTLTIAEIAGITVKAKAITQAGGSGAIKTGDQLFFDFEITNEGNDPTQFFLPGTPSQILGGTQNGSVKIISSKGTALGSPVNIPANGDDTEALLGSVAAGSFAPGESVIVRVTLDVIANTSGAPIRVVYGDTNSNDNSANTQNQDYVASSTANADVYTQDNANGSVTDEQSGPPANGDSVNHRKEASAYNETYLEATPRAFATVLKTAGVGAPIPGDAPNVDLPYNLSLRVEGVSLDTKYTAAALQGTALTVDGVSEANMVLVSDVIPTNTTLSSVGTPPPGWTVVYSNSDPAANNASALEVNWSRTIPTTIGAVKRIGFIYNAGTLGPVDKGVTVSGFKFTVKTAVPSTGGTIANIAQAFGQTNAGPAENLVYDESGDQNPNNYNGNTPSAIYDDLTPTEFNNLNNDLSEGIPNAGSQGIDSNNDNTGTGADGEVNSITLGTPIDADSILMGPNGKPAAIGPTNQNDDFTNLATKYGSATNPDEVTFNNTIKNTSVAPLTNILVRPIVPTIPANLPVGTLVSVKVGSNTAVYEYKLTGAVYSFDLVSGTPIQIPTLDPDDTLPVEVKVDLPNGTDLSTADGVIHGYEVPIVAFTDEDGSGTYNTGDVGNITIDRVYVGFLKLLKQARILDPNGNPLTPYFTTINPADEQYVKAGNTIQYRVLYLNISEAEVGTDNVTLTAKNLVITEDGNQAPNNWFDITVDPKASAGSPGSATTTSTGTLTATFSTNSSGENDIEIYTLDSLEAAPAGPISLPLTPGEYTGNMVFKRTIK